ncbi:MAG: tetratricopeptide repeat protein, partial [Bacteroidales bacterium]|nr:tetratricopeptide repeat protein [Bacteroidales bacterium]
MKGLVNILVVIVLIIILPFEFSCSNRLAPGIKGGISKKTFDNSAFDFYFVEAVRQKLMGSPSEALRLLEQCLKINPQSDAVYYQMAQIAMQGGDIENGKKLTMKAYSLDPGNIWYIMTIAGIYYEQEKLDSAIMFYEKAVKLKPDREDLRLNLGNLYAENKDYVKARQIFDNIGSENGLSESSALSMIKTLMEEGKYQEAQKRIEELIREKPDEILYNGLLAEIYRGQGQSEKALEVYNRLMTKNPDDPQTLLAVCDFLLDEKRYSDLLIVLNTLILNDNITREEKISVFARLMESESAISEHSQGIELAIRVLEANYPGDDIILLLRPELLEKENKLKEASMRLNEIIEAKPENYYAWERLLLVYYKMKDWKNLLVKGEECATRFNRSFLAKVLYANAAMENEKYDLALDEL